MSETWYCKVIGQEVGPLTRDELSALLDQGQISLDDQIRSNEHAAWQRLSRVFPEMAAKPASERSWFFRSFGEEFGPYTLGELKEFVAQQQLAASDDVREGKTGSWKQARLVTGLFPEGENILAGFDSLENAPDEPPPKSNQPAGRSPATQEPATTTAPPAARLKPDVAPPETPARRPVERTSTPPRTEPPVPPKTSPISPAPPSGAESSKSTAAAIDDMPKSASATENPPPRAPVAPPPPYAPPASRSSGGGFELPEWLSSGTTIGIAVGLIVLLGGGWFLTTSSFMSSLNADNVYQDVVTLYAEFKTASRDGRTSPAFTTFYDKFKEQQSELFDAIGQPAPDTSAFQVKHALQYLGSVIEAFNREKTTEKAQRKYVETLEEQLKKLEPEYGG